MTKNEGMAERIAAESCESFASGSIPESARSAARTLILDWLGCVLLGAEAPSARAIAAAHADEIGSGLATCFVGPSLCSPNLAALISGVAGHAMELDDIYSPAMYHPAVCVISAAFAAGQLKQASGDRFIRGVIAGYEISNRIGAAINPEHYKFWHTTGTVGTIGAAMAAAVVLGLDVTQCGYALGNATSMAAGLQQAFRSDGMTKPLHAGHAAQSGFLAARIAAANFTGSTDMITGPVGLATAMSHGRDISMAFDDLFKVWTVERSTFKRFSSCGHTFASVDALLEMLKEAPINPDEVESVEIEAYRATIEVGGIANPKSPFEARFSTQFGIAAALLGYDLMNPATFDDLYADPAIHALIPRVRLSVSPQIEAAAPKLRGAHVTVKLKNGAVRELFMKTRKGDPDNPLTAADLQDKFMRLVGATSQREQASALLQWVHDLPRLAKLTASSVPLKGAGSTKLRAV